MSLIITNPTIQAAVASAVALPLLFASFVLLEPALVVGQTDSNDFTIQQTINNEIAFTAQPQNVVMDTPLTGLTGGTSNGSTTFSVATNNPNGYTVAIRFANAGSGNAMAYNSSPTDTFITNGPGTVSFDFDPPAANSPALFAYTVDGAHAAQTFRSTASTCDSGAGSTDGESCFLMQSTITTNEEIMRRTSASAGGDGDSLDLYFRVVVGQDPDPVLPSGTYTATATLTAQEL